MISSVSEFDTPEHFWYDRARRFYDAWDGDSTQYVEQARIWLNQYDFGMAEIAWALVKMERENDEDLG